MTKLSDKAVLTEAQHNYRVAVRHQQKWKRDAKTAYRFYAGDQLNADDKHKLEQEKRPIVQFNMIGPNVKAVVGMQAANRTEIRFVAMDGAAPEEQSFADWANELLKKSDEDSDGEMELSSAFRDTVISGMGWTQRTIDFEHDPRGTMVKRSIDPLRKWWDPSAKQHNLIDRKFDFTEIFMDKWEFEALYPDVKLPSVGGMEQLQTPVEGGNPFSVGGEEHEQFDTEVEHEEAQDPYRGEHSSPDGYERMKDKIRIIEYNYWKWEKSIRVFADPEDKIIEEEDWAAFKASLIASGVTPIKVEAGVNPEGNTNPDVVFYQETRQREFYKVKFLGPMVLEHEENIDPTGFNEHCITGDLDRATGLWYGIVRPMIDPQLWSNKLFMQLMMVVMSNPKGGVYYKKGAFASPEKAKEDFATAAPFMEVKVPDGQTIENVIHERQPSQYPTGLSEIMSYAASIIPRVTGINQELLGMVQKDQPGILEHLRQQAGMTILASLFDSLRAYHKLDGRTALYLMRHAIPVGRQQEILGRVNADLPQLVAQLPASMDRWAIKADEAPYSPNRKFMVFKMLTDLGTTNPEMQTFVAPLLLDFLPLPEKVVEEAKKQIQGSQQASQQRQQQTDSTQMMLALAEIKEMLAKAEKATADSEVQRASIGRDDALAPAKALAEVGSAVESAGVAKHMQAKAVSAPVEAVAKLVAATKPAAGEDKTKAKPLAYEPRKTGA